MRHDRIRAELESPFSPNEPGFEECHSKRLAFTISILSFPPACFPHQAPAPISTFLSVHVHTHNPTLPLHPRRSSHHISMASDVPNQACRTCRLETKRTFVCVQCNNWAFCDDCWAKRDVHEAGAVGWDGRPHEKSDPNVLRIFRQILDPIRSEADVDTEHQADEETVWFGVDRDAPHGPVFQDYDRFATLVSEGQTLELKRKYPALVSFIGQTGQCRFSSDWRLWFVSNSAGPPARRRWQEHSHQNAYGPSKRCSWRFWCQNGISRHFLNE